MEAYLVKYLSKEAQNPTILDLALPVLWYTSAPINIVRGGNPFGLYTIHSLLPSLAAICFKILEITDLLNPPFLGLIVSFKTT